MINSMRQKQGEDDDLKWIISQLARKEWEEFTYMPEFSLDNPTTPKRDLDHMSTIFLPPIPLKTDDSYCMKYMIDKLEIISQVYRAAEDEGIFDCDKFREM